MFKSFTDFLYHLSFHRINIFRVIFIIFLCGARIQIFAVPEPGELDITFNQVGEQPGSIIFKIDQAETGSAGFGCEMQKDGKILISGVATIDGVYRFAVSRLNQNGTLDQGFNGTGTNAIKIDQLELTSEAMRLLVQVDGKIIVFGNVTLPDVGTKFVVARLMPNGVLDTNFNENAVEGQPGTATVKINGSSLTRCFAGAIQKDGKIVLAGEATIEGQKKIAAVRFNADGTLDESFNTSGDQSGVALTVIDNNTGDNECFHFVLDNGLIGNQKIILAGSTTDVADINNPVKKFGVVRFNSNGTLDENFNYSGVKPGTVSTLIDNNTDSTCYGIFIQTGEKIILAGSTYDSVNTLNKFAAARLNNDGSVDESFNTSGTRRGTVSTKIDEASNSMGVFGAMQVNNKLLVTGMSFESEARFAIARFTDVGELDSTFNSSGILPGTVSAKIGETSEVNYAYSSIVQEDGKIILAGSIMVGSVQQFAVARFIGDYFSISPAANYQAIVTIDPKIKDQFSIRLIEKYGPMFAQDF